ncbi:Type 1 glutamine amidotransferase-like domain-containing protein [Erysipelothrix urinaevulpis]
MKADVIEFIRASNTVKFLKNFSNTNILIGMSASSLILQKVLTLINQLTPEMNFLNLTNINTLNLVVVEILPHWNKLEDRSPNIHKVLNNYNYDVITLSD